VRILHKLEVQRESSGCMRPTLPLTALPVTLLNIQAAKACVLRLSEGIPVRSEARHRLKEDRFAVTAKDTYSWAVEHRTNLVGGVVVAAIIIAAALGAYFYNQTR